MRYFEKISGEKLYLSPINQDDVENYVRWLSDRSVTDGLGNTASLISLQTEREWLQKASETYQFAIVKRENNTLIGNCGIESISHVHRTAEVGLFIGEEENRGKGYGTQALELLVDYGFQVLNLHSLMLRVYSFNERAIACYQKVGFREFGRRRQCYYLNGTYYDSIHMDLLKQERNNILHLQGKGIQR
ncbi:MAG TPA: GNAT family N-acetyltransferase [Firmicutes bacterium]|nr:GNAT family N-acetyltransferase [Bacillota bacterium]